MSDETSEKPLLGNRYQLMQTLGSGGMSVVYRAYDTMLERMVAIKILRQDYSSDPAFRERFRHEAKAAANLSHPNIVTVHDFGLDNERLYIVMEYVAGNDLKMLMKQRGRFSLEEAIPLIVQACAGIGYAHRAGLVHCDVKPHNILVSTDQRIKVTDFGIARALSTIHPDEQSDIVWGSPQYFSPEQASGAAPSPASDVYSLGVILYEMLTGRLPFPSTDPVELARQHREEVPPAPRRFNPSIPPGLDKIILKVLSKEGSQRYRTAEQFGRVLDNFFQQLNAGTSQFSVTGTPVAAAAIPASQRVQTSTTNSRPPANSVIEGIVPGASAPSRPSAPVRSTQNYSKPTPITSPRKRISETSPHLVAPASGSNPANMSLNIDWVAVGLGLLATAAVAGLIPLWLFVYMTIFPPR